MDVSDVAEKQITNEHVRGMVVNWKRSTIDVSAGCAGGRWM
jgi:hypothetical protein